MKVTVTLSDEQYRTLAAWAYCERMKPGRLAGDFIREGIAEAAKDPSVAGALRAMKRYQIGLSVVAAPPQDREDDG